MIITRVLELEPVVGRRVGFHVAFFLLRFRSIVVMERMNGAMSLAAALSPIPAGMLAIALWTRHYKRRYGDS